MQKEVILIYILRMPGMVFMPEKKLLYPKG